MTNPIDTSAQHADDSNDVTAPSKPSLRVLELGSPATREQDLANGPLLLGLGDGQNDHIAYPEMDLGSPVPGLHRPEESVLPMMPPRLPRALATESLTQSTTTEAGASYSTPSQAHVSNQSLRGESVGPSPTQDSETTVFPWTIEFSWNESGLCFGDDPLEITRTPEDHYSKVDPGSESAFLQPYEPATKVLAQHVPDDDFIRYGLAGMGAHSEHSSPTELPDDLEAAFTICSISSGTPSISGTTDSDAAMESFENDPLITMQKCAASVIELLVDGFFRSYAPQSSQGRATGASQKGIQSASYNRTGEGSGPSREGRARANSRKRKALGDDEGSEDENFQNKKGKSIATESSEDSLRWVCPFVRWRPKRYNCLVAPKEIRKLKAHIKNMHWNKHCDNCLIKNPPPGHVKQPCVPSRPRRGFITKEMKAKIDQRESCRDTHKEQWNRIYRVLFPGEDPEELGKIPYHDKETLDSLRTAKEFSASPECEEVIQRFLAKCKFRGKFRKQVEDMIHEGLILELVPLIRLFMSRDGKSEQLAQDVPQEVEPPRCDLIEGSSPEEATAALDPVGQASPRSQGGTIAYRSFPEWEPPQASIFDPQSSTEQPIVDNNAPRCHYDLVDLKDPLANFEPEDEKLCHSRTLSMSWNGNSADDLQFDGQDTNEAQLRMLLEMNDYNWPDLSATMSFPDEL